MGVGAGSLQKDNKFDIKSIISMREFPVLAATIFLFVVLSLLSENFVKSTNIINVIRQATLIIILAVGEAFVLIAGEVDISVGALMGLTGIMAALFTNAGIPPVLVFVLTMVTGVSFGIINAFLVTKLKLMSFVATLGTLSIIKGLMLIITGGFSIKFESLLAFMGYGYIGAIPLSVIIMVVIVVVAHIALNNTCFGRKVFATGSNYKAARISGVKVDGIKTIAFALSGFLSAVAGIILAGNMLSADPIAGVGYEMDVVAACIIGGTTLLGGEGSVVGVVLGCLLMSLLRNGFVLLGIPSSWQIIATGLVIVISVILDSVKNNKNRI